MKKYDDLNGDTSSGGVEAQHLEKICPQFSIAARARRTTGGALQTCKNAPPRATPS